MERTRFRVVGLVTLAQKSGLLRIFPSGFGRKCVTLKPFFPVFFRLIAVPASQPSLSVTLFFKRTDNNQAKIMSKWFNLTFPDDTQKIIFVHEKKIVEYVELFVKPFECMIVRSPK